MEISCRYISSDRQTICLIKHILLQIKHKYKAEEIYQALLKREPSEEDQVHYYDRLRLIKDRQDNHREAIKYYERAVAYFI